MKVCICIMDVECIARLNAVQNFVRIRQLLKDIDPERTRPTKVFIDIQSVRQLARKNVLLGQNVSALVTAAWVQYLFSCLLNSD